MNAYEVTREKYYDGTEDTLNKKTLALAYLQMYLENPALHPDSYLDPACGHSGWHVLLVHRVLTTFERTPEYFKYPTALYRYTEWAYNQFLAFHEDDEDDEFREKLDRVYNWLQDMTVLDLHATLHDIEDLVMFHDGSPEGEFHVISDLCSTLEFVSGLSS